MIERLEPRQLLSTVSVAPDSYTVTHDQTLSTGWGGVLQNDYGYDDTYSGSTLTASVVSGPAHGSLSLAANGAFVYTPNVGFAGSDGFTYAASIGGVTATSSASITVMNNVPYAYANASSFTVTHDQALNVTWSGVSVYDWDGDALTQTLVSNVAHGTLDLHSDGTFQYTPSAGYTGTDGFSFNYVDSLGAASSTIGFTINVVNNAPSAYAWGTSFTVAHDRLLDVNWSAVSAYDPDGDALTQTLVSNVAHGTLDLHTNGTFQYTPAAGYTGTDSFSFKYVDTIGAESSTLGFTINVGNAAPYAYANGSASFTVAHDHLLNVTSPVVYAYDPDGDALTQTVVTNVAHGTLDLHSDGTFQYTPAAGYIGADSFSFKYVDSLGAESSTLGFTVNVVNNAPYAYANGSMSFTVVRDHLLNVTSPVVYTYDPDGDFVTANILSTGAHGTPDFHSDGTFTYMPDAGYVGSDGFSVQFVDSLGAASTPLSFQIEVTNQRPSANPDSGYFDLGGATLTVDAATGVLSNDFDADPGTQLIAQIVSDGQWGHVELHSDGSFTYAVNAESLDDPAFNGTDTFTYCADDQSNAPDGSNRSEVAAVAVAVVNPKIQKLVPDPNNEFNTIPQDVTNKTEDVLVGFKLTRNVADASNTGKEFTATWSIGGTPIKDYKIETNTVTPWPANDNEKKNKTIQWGWATDSGLKTVSAEVSMNGMTVTVSTKFNVIRPTVDVAVSVAQSPAISGTTLKFGTAGAPGIRLTPNNLSNPGSLKWIQIVTSVSRTYTNADQHGRGMSGTTLLDSIDTDAQYPAPDGILTDSPSMPLAYWPLAVRAQVADTFDAYLMYKPSGAAFFVPLRVVNWWWSATASRPNKDSNQWTLESAECSESPAAADAGAYPPMWNGRVLSLPWTNF